ncbi:Ldh family oxidoreductase [Salibacterium salarium]|uniref:Ldh family oxidoreductase n=1 Tax=Salibacterium salarium TaxID=284579 RepID=A0A3R9P5Y7_9BACI|nr:Ldh family oxidoreductase [Salibacterium salarium]RSL31935.1 Ldh family oxidoreductase [Salibacterium salarium]
MTRRFDWVKLENFCEEIFHKAGLSRKDAKTVAESLIEANLRGVDSHGVVRSYIYLRRIHEKMINPNNEMVVEVDGTVTLLDGKNQMGSVIGKKAMELALAATKEHGTGIVGVKGSNHFGTCAYYLEEAIKEDIVMFVFSNASQTMPPTGGIRPFIGTNPFSFGAPTGNHPPFILDMATSEVARGKIINAFNKGESIPEGWALDKDGNHTTDASKALEGSVLPMAGPKGYALSMLIDILSGVLTGSGFGKYVNNMYENWVNPQNVGHFFIGIDISKFMPVDVFKKRIDKYLDEIKAEPKKRGIKEILIPGEIEYRSKQKRRKMGIELPLKVEKELKEWGKIHDVDLEKALKERQ